ncbi:MAG: heavy-metal-associated domain-containing protein [Marinobacter sp.]|nr:heavy-metal-associated domain-containing protein [Marinobacter sp.]
MKTVRNLMILATIVSSLFAATIPAYGSEAVPQTRVVTLEIRGMSTPQCPALVEAAVRRVVGVHTVVANLATKTATVHYDPSRSQPGDFQKAVRQQVGFRSEVRY